MPSIEELEASVNYLTELIMENLRDSDASETKKKQNRMYIKILREKQAELKAKKDENQ